MIPGTRPSGAETVRQTVHTSAPHFQDPPPAPARGPLSSDHLGGNAFDQLQVGQRLEEGQLGSVLPAAASRSQFCQEYLETGVAREAGGEVPCKCPGWGGGALGGDG